MSGSPETNEAAALKCIYMALMSLDPTGTGRRRWTMRWKAPLNAFQIAFEGRLTPAIAGEESRMPETTEKEQWAQSRRRSLLARGRAGHTIAVRRRIRLRPRLGRKYLWPVR